MSGGVDSSVAAYLLKKEGYEVGGVYLQVWSDKDYISDCPWHEDIESAEAAAKHLNIPFRALHIEDEYKKKVVEYLIDGYRRGRTPNPDIMCNREIKFGVFLEWAINQGAEYVATGHYARLRRKFRISPAHSPVASKAGGNFEFRIKSPNLKVSKQIKLLKGIDKNKDQSYFLHQLNQKQLSKILFPIGNMTKPNVRKLAKKIGLPNAERKDSQGICFIGKVQLPRFLQEYITPKKGDIITSDGKKIGEHNGIFYYTLGQRHGLDIGSATGDTAYYIVEKRIDNNTIVVARGRKNPLLYTKEIICDSIHWIGEVPPSMPLACTAKIRYRQEDQKCTVYQIPNTGYQILFRKPQFAAAPGQSVVFYRGQECLGGGIIKIAKVKSQK